MPSVSKKQQRLMAAAEHGATFPMAKKLRRSMTHDQLHDFAAGSMKGKPERVSRTMTVHERDTSAAKKQSGGHVHRMGGSHDGMTITEHHRKGRKP
jgi:hypothetical protein